MFSIKILCLMSNLSFKGDTLYRLIPSGGIDLFIPRIVLRRIQYHGTPAANSAALGLNTVQYIAEQRRFREFDRSTRCSGSGSDAKTVRPQQYQRRRMTDEHLQNEILWSWSYSTLEITDFDLING